MKHPATSISVLAAMLGAVLLSACHPKEASSDAATAANPVATPAESESWTTFESETGPSGLTFDRPSGWIVQLENRETPTGTYSRVRCLRINVPAAESFMAEMMVMDRPAAGPSLEERYQLMSGAAFAPSATVRKVSTKNGGAAILWRDDRGPVHYDHALVFSGSKMITVRSEFERTRPIFERIVTGIGCR
jgi:hypothetical protein